MARLLLLLLFGVSGCPGVDKPRQRSPAVEETPTGRVTPTNTPPTLPVRTPMPRETPPQLILPTPTERETLHETEVAEEIEKDSDPRSAAEVDTAVLPSVWVYFSRDDKRGYRSVFLFGHREKVSNVQVSYAEPFLVEFKNSGYSGMNAEEKTLFVKRKLQLQLSFLFNGQSHCGSVAIQQDNIVPAGGKMDKDKSLKIALKSESC